MKIVFIVLNLNEFLSSVYHKIYLKNVRIFFLSKSFGKHILQNIFVVFSTEYKLIHDSEK